MGATRLSAPARHAGVHLTFPKTVLRQTFLCFTLGLCFIGSSASAWAQSTPAYCSTNIQEEQAIFETHLQYSRNPHIDQIFKVKPPLLSIQVPGVVLATTQVERIKEYNSIGIDLFFLAGYPHLEEAYRLGEHVLPHFKNQRQALQRIPEESKYRIA